MPDKLYIIGNGFDLHHGLKTSYVNFRDNYAKSKTHFWRRLLEIYGDALNGDMWWWNFEEMLGAVDYQHLLRSWNGEALGSNKIKNLLGNEIPVSIGQWIEEVERSAAPEKKLTLDPDAYFFSFNYSLLLEKLYGVNVDHVWHIHNSLTDFKNGEHPVVGHDSDIGQLTIRLADYEKTHPNTKGVFVDMINDEIANGAKKAKNRIQLSDGRFASLYSDIKHYIVMGFSFNEIDMPYIEEIVKVNNNIQSTDWEVYWHSDGERDLFFEKLLKLEINEARITLIKW